MARRGSHSGCSEASTRPLSRCTSRPSTRCGSKTDSASHVDPGARRGSKSSVGTGFRRSASTGGTGRFSEEERRSFGRWSFIGAKDVLKETGLPAPARTPSNLGLALEGEPSRRSACAVDLGYEPSQVRGILERILPMSTKTPGSHSPAPRSPTAVPQVAASDPGRGEASASSSPRVESECDGVGGNGEPLNAPGKFRHEVLEKFRQQLLQRFLSLHDAFSRLNIDASRDKNLTPQEFRKALEQLCVGEEDADEIFAAMDTHDVGGVNIAGFLHALVDISPEALLWELRCRCVRFNLGQHNLDRTLELVRWPQHGWQSRATKVKRRSTRIRPCCRCASCGEGISENPAQADISKAAISALYGGTRPDPDSANIGHDLHHDDCWKPRPSEYHLTRSDWLKFCTSMYLTLLEAERLFTCLADKRRLVDLRAMFEMLRKTVEPDVSLERFVSKLLARYESLDDAWARFSEDRSYLPNCPEPLMWWSGFQKLAIALNVNDKNAAELWNVLTGSLQGRELEESKGSLEVDDKSGMSVGKSSFLRELALWAPDTALGALKDRLCVRFGSLAEGHRALQRAMPQSEELQASELDGRLRAAGIKNCNVSKALSSVAKSRAGAVTLDATIDTMRCLRRIGSSGKPELGTAAISSVRNQTQPLWECLQSVQTDCLRRYDDNSDVGHRPAPPARELPLAPPAPPVPPIEDQNRFTEAIHGAVRTSQTSHSQSVLRQAHRQVLSLEKRWAHSPRGPSASPEPRDARSPPNPHGRSPTKDIEALVKRSSVSGATLKMTPSKPLRNWSCPSLSPPSAAKAA